MKFAPLAILALASTLAAAQAPTGPYKILKTVKVGGEGGYDYVTADSESRRLYIGRSGASAAEAIVPPSRARLKAKAITTRERRGKETFRTSRILRPDPHDLLEHQSRLHFLQAIGPHFIEGAAIVVQVDVATGAPMLVGL